MVTDFFSKSVFFILLFFAVSILISELLGLVWLNSSIIFLISLVFSFFLFRKFFPPDFHIPVHVLLLALFLLVLLSYPLMIITPGYPASADAATTTSVRVLLDRIPLDYQPYSGINFAYQIGFPLLANIFSDVFPIMADYNWAWFLSLFSSVLLFFGVYFFSKEFIGESGGIWAALIFFGGKLFFENFYVGEYPWILATAFLLFTLYFYQKKSPLAYLCFPLVFILHPLIALNLLIFMAIFFIYYPPSKTELLFFTFSLAAASPAFYLNYSVPISNILAGNLPSAPISGFFQNFFQAISIFIPWIGIGAGVALALSFVFIFLEKKFFTSKKQIYLTAFFSISCGIFIFAYSAGLFVSGRLIELVLLSSIFLSAYNFSIVNSVLIKKKVFIKAFILGLSLVIFFSSSVLVHLRDGGNFPEEYRAFVEEFKEKEPALKEVLVLSPRRGKIAEFSNKIPFDLNNSNAVNTQDYVYLQNEAFFEFREKSMIWEKISGGCVECIYKLKIDYVVINTDFFHERLNLPVFFESPPFTVYSKS